MPTYCDAPVVHSERVDPESSVGCPQNFHRIGKSNFLDSTSHTLIEPLPAAETLVPLGLNASTQLEPRPRGI